MTERVFAFSGKSPVVNPDEYFALDSEANRLVCLSLRDIHVINSYLWPFVEWRTRFSRPYIVGHRQESTAQEFDQFLLGMSELSERIGEASMGSCYEGMLAIAEALKYAANASLSAGNCCDVSPGSAGAGRHSPPFDPANIANPGQGDPPDGFESWEQYYANKCAVATDIVVTAKATLNNYDTLNLAGQVLVSLIPALIALSLIPIPGDEIVVIAGILLLVIAYGDNLLNKAIDVFSDFEQELICALYEAPNAEAATSNFVTVFSDGWVSNGNPSAFTWSMGSLIHSMVGPSSTNRLFVLETTRTLPEGDCGGCQTGVEIIEIRNAGSEYVDSGWVWGEEVTFQPVVEGNGFYYSFIRLSNVPTGAQPSDYVFDVTSNNTSDTGSCGTMNGAPGQYNPVNLNNEGILYWYWGCTNVQQPTIVGTFTRNG